MLHGTESFQNTEAEYTKNRENHDKTVSASSEIDTPEVPHLKPTFIATAGTFHRIRGRWY